MSNSLIQLSDIDVIYKDPNGKKFNALSKVSTIINQGEYVAILGTSGSGKTTLSNIVGLLNNDFKGDYIFDDIEVNKISDRKRVQLRGEKFGFIFQDYVLLENLTAIENVSLALQYSNISKKEIYKKALDKLIAVGLGDKINHRPFQLSGGQKQRVSIARALIKDPMVIIADEPTGALDHNSRVEVLSILQELNEQGVTIITVTHSDEDARAAKRIIKVEKGLVAYDLPQRNRIRYFGKLIDLENKHQVDLRKELVLDYVNLNYGIKNLESFLQAGLEADTNEQKLILLNQFDTSWMLNEQVKRLLVNWFSNSDEVIQLLVVLNLITFPDDDFKDDLKDELDHFLNHPWSEEVSMYFLKSYEKFRADLLFKRVNVAFLSQHESSKVRATAVQLFFKNENKSLLDLDKYLPIILKDIDARVRSNMLDYLYKLNKFDLDDLKKYEFDKDPAPRVKAIWVEMLILKGEDKDAKKIINHMLVSDSVSEILSAVWVLSKDKNFNIGRFVSDTSKINPSIVVFIDDILKTYNRVQKDLSDWRQTEHEAEADI